MCVDERKGKHLTFVERLTIERMERNNFSKKDIATAIGCCRTTIYNELRRSTYVHTNTDLTEEIRYNPSGAQSRYEELLQKKGRAAKISLCPELATFIEYLICEQNYSPAAVLSEIRNNNIKFAEAIKSVNTIYNAIEKGRFKQLTLEQLPQANSRGKKHKRCVKVQKRLAPGISIEKRPKNILERSTFGHWEMDTVIGKARNKKTILVLTERKTRYEIVEVLKRKTADEVVKALNRLEKRYGKMFYDIFKSITVDNGSEFSNVDGLEKAVYRVGKRTKIYYCHPYSSWERGSNENANKLVRRFFPKKTDFDTTVTRSKVKDMEFWMNSYPRPMFNGLCANDLFTEEMAKLGYDELAA